MNISIGGDLEFFQVILVFSKQLKSCSSVVVVLLLRREGGSRLSCFSSY